MARQKLMATSKVKWREKICSAEFREYVLKTYPTDDPRFLRFLEWLFFSTNYDAERLSERRLRLSHGDIYYFVNGRRCEYNDNEYKHFLSKPFLDEVKEKLLPEFTYEHHDVANKKPRIVTNRGLTTNDLMYENVELKTGAHATNRVYFVTGKRFGDTEKKALHQAEREHGLMMLGLGDNEDSNFIIGQLAEVPKRLYTDIFKRNLDAAYSVVAELSEEDQHRQYLILHNSEPQPKPYYGPSSKGQTPRVFARIECFLSLKREVKAALIEGWWTYDLKSCHLAVAAKHWPIPELHTFLSDGGDVWVELCNTLSSRCEPVLLKRILKKATYKIVYGSPEAEVRRFLVKKLELPARYLTPFFSHWIVKRLFEARNAELAKLKAAGEAADVYGTVHRLADIKVRKSTHVEGSTRFEATMRDRRARSLLSRLAQAVEVKLVAHAYRFAAEHSNDMMITCHQHDGFDVHFYRRPELWNERLLEHVNSNLMGVATMLKLTSRPETQS